MAITPFTNPPGRGQGPNEFAARADNFLGVQLPRFVTEANSLALQAGLAAQTVAAASNYRGVWANLSGPMSVPSSVMHAGRYWMLNEPLANVALSEPGVDVGRWVPVQRGMRIISSNAQLLAGDDVVSTASGAVTLTLPAGPSNGDSLTVARMGAGVVTIARNGSTILSVADNLDIDTANQRILLVFAGGTWRVSLEGLTA